MRKQGRGALAWPGSQNGNGAPAPKGQGVARHRCDKNKTHSETRGSKGQTCMQTRLAAPLSERQPGET